MPSERREWLQFLLNLTAAAAAVFVFFRYDARTRRLADNLTTINTELARIQKQSGVIALQRDTLEFKGSRGRKLEVTKQLQSTRVDSSVARGYKLDFQYTLKNVGLDPIEVTNALVEAYVGSIPNSQSPLVLNQPLENGPVNWVCVQRRAYFAPSRWVRGVYIESSDPSARPAQIDAVSGGGGTGKYNKGEYAQDGLILFVPVNSGDLVAVIVNMTLDQKDGRRFAIIDSVSNPASAAPKK